MFNQIVRPALIAGAVTIGVAAVAHAAMSPNRQLLPKPARLASLPDRRPRSRPTSRAARRSRALWSRRISYRRWSRRPRRCRHRKVRSA
jgi:hypothetical protein